jgi:hypothetical protein
MKKYCGLALLIAILVVEPVSAETQTLETLFPRRAKITSAGSGLNRLELPAEVLAACRTDLANVRILTTDGREIPYVVDSPEPAGRAVALHYGGRPEIITAERSRRALDERNTIYRESFVLSLPALPADVPAWDLLLTVSQADFVGRLNVTALGRDGARTPIISGGSVFRLRSAGAEKLRFTISDPNTSRIEVVLESEGSGYLEPRFNVQSSRFLEEAGTSAVGLTILEARDLADATEFVIDRPRGLVPRRLVITTSTDTFHRRITVWDEGPGSDPEPLGVGAVLRIAAVAPVEVLEIPVRPPRGDRLRLVIENEDSPPLGDVRFAASMRRPVLVFSIPEGPPEAMLYFGGARARRPRYDLAALDPQGRLPVGGEDARRALALLDPELAQTATLGGIGRNPEYDAAPALAFAMRPGATIDARLFSHQRRLEVQPSTEGLSRLHLEPADLAVLQADLADLRILDEEGRQWAYLSQQRARTVFSPLALVDNSRDDRISHYEIEVPDGPLALDRIEIETNAPFFDRVFALRGHLEDGGETLLASGRLVRRTGDPRPSTITVEPVRVIRLDLEISDGDDAPLDILEVVARSSVPDIYTAAVAGEYTLLLGYPDAAAPVYELEQIRSTILAVPAGMITAGELEPNPDFSPASRLSRSGGAQQFLLWGVLGLAVIVLVIVTLRAARQEARQSGRQRADSGEDTDASQHRT